LYRKIAILPESTGIFTAEVKKYSLHSCCLAHIVVRMKAPYTQFDLPNRHLVGTNQYVPPKARSSSEIDRRHAMPSGTIVLEQQHRGLQAAHDLLRNVSDENDILYVAQIIGACGLNSGWYQFAKGSRVMRRQLQLPYLARPDAYPRPTSDEVLAQASGNIQRTAELAGKLATLRAENRVGQQGLGQRLGRVMANAALEIACAPFADDIAQTSPFNTQAAVRTQSLEVLERSRALGYEIGTPPSFAQLADPNSDLSVHIRREAPTDACYAFEAALDAYAMPR
jgi:hypothetical protein